MIKEIRTIYILNVKWKGLEEIPETIGEFDNLHDLVKARKAFIQYYGWEENDTRIFSDVVELNKLRPMWHKVMNFCQ